MSFTQFHFHPGIQSGIRDAGYTSPTPIQQKAIPPILDGKDILGLASTIVFTRTKHKAKSLADQLKRSGFNAVSLQGNLSQNQGHRAMDGFRSGSFKILVATDIAARGIDVSGVSHVINYDLPDTVETYIHRTGRTGRANQAGQAYTFTTMEDNKTITLIEKALGRKMTQE
ncbi:DEAD/DEAH box helicase [Desulfobacter sp.]|uniref:DEAD/DEAH box helicase n=1 Tax=Desulfobacter sp. TaxID=2294 RepID=UPI002579DA38|nr:DEAD/DEAH box helicase [Desulfobacter sp.]